MRLVTLNLSSRIKVVTGATFDLGFADTTGLHYVKQIIPKSQQQYMHDTEGLLVSNELLLSPEALLQNTKSHISNLTAHTRHRLTLLRASIASVCAARILVPEVAPAGDVKDGGLLVWIPSDKARIMSIAGEDPHLGPALQMGGLIRMDKDSDFVVHAEGADYRAFFDGTQLHVNDRTTNTDVLWA